MNEDSRGHRRCYKEEKLYSKFQDKFHRRKHSKDEEKCENTLLGCGGAPQVCKKRIGAPQVSIHTRGTCTAGKKQLFVVFLLRV